MDLVSGYPCSVLVAGSTKGGLWLAGVHACAYAHGNTHKARLPAGTLTLLLLSKGPDSRPLLFRDFIGVAARVSGFEPVGLRPAFGDTPSRPSSRAGAEFVLRWASSFAFLSLLLEKSEPIYDVYAACRVVGACGFPRHLIYCILVRCV